MKTIVFDVDGVLADFIQGFTNLANGLYGTPVITTAMQPTWDGYPGMNGLQIDGTWDVIKKKDWTFWYNLHPLVSNEVFQRINDLSDDNQVYFVTARIGREAKQQTEGWLHKHGIVYPTVIISPNKGEACQLVKATHAIEDKAGNAIAIQYMSSARSYIIDRPYNRYDNSVVGTKVKRVKTVDEFLNDVEAKVAA
jgi:uncharacterized HAD superfamily protein